MHQPTDSRPLALPAVAEAYGYAGMAPFLLAALGTGLLPDVEARDWAQRLAVGYGAAILAFVGAVHWGLALAGRLPNTLAVYAGSILPSVAATVAVVLGGQRGLALLVVSFGLFWLYEAQRLAAELPPDYLRLRRNLSLAVCALLALTMIISDSVGLP